MGSVSIPASDLRDRISELPLPEHPLRIANTDGAGEALNFLRAGRRRARITDAFSYGDSGRARLWSPSPWVLNRPGPGRVLDLGCGAGREAVALAAQGWDVIAIDHLPEALDRARVLERAALGEPRVRWMLADVRQEVAGVTGEVFDLVLAFRLHVPAAVARAWAYVRPGGTLLGEWRSSAGPAPPVPRAGRGSRLLRTPAATFWDLRRP